MINSVCPTSLAQQPSERLTECIFVPVQILSQDNLVQSSHFWAGFCRLKIAGQLISWLTEVQSSPLVQCVAASVERRLQSCIIPFQGIVHRHLKVEGAGHVRHMDQSQNQPQKGELGKVLLSRTRGKIVVDVNVREDCVHSSVFDQGMNICIQQQPLSFFLIREGSDNLITN